MFIAHGKLIEIKIKSLGHRWNCTQVWRKDIFGHVVIVGESVNRLKLLIKIELIRCDRTINTKPTIPLFVHEIFFLLVLRLIIKAKKKM